MGTALNKILKDLVVKFHQMSGKDSVYVPGWDCHGLPIEWKVEENFREKGKNKDQIPINSFRSECRKFAQKWVLTLKVTFGKVRFNVARNFWIDHVAIFNYFRQI